MSAYGCLSPWLHHKIEKKEKKRKKNTDSHAVLFIIYYLFISNYYFLILWCNWHGNNPEDNLAIFGY
jgi:hypothetical protein